MKLLNVITYKELPNKPLVLPVSTGLKKQSQIKQNKIFKTKCMWKEKFIKNMLPQLETKPELWENILDEGSSCRSPIKLDKPNLCLHSLPFICHISCFDLC